MYWISSLTSLTKQKGCSVCVYVVCDKPNDFNQSVSCSCYYTFWPLDNHLFKLEYLGFPWVLEYAENHSYSYVLDIKHNREPYHTVWLIALKLYFNTNENQAGFKNMCHDLGLRWCFFLQLDWACAQNSLHWQLMNSAFTSDQFLSDHLLLSCYFHLNYIRKISLMVIGLVL